jgi:hypothetical protein
VPRGAQIRLHRSNRHHLLTGAEATVLGVQLFAGAARRRSLTPATTVRGSANHAMTKPAWASHATCNSVGKYAFQCQRRLDGRSCENSTQDKGRLLLDRTKCSTGSAPILLTGRASSHHQYISTQHFKRPGWERRVKYLCQRVEYLWNPWRGEGT